MRPTPNSNAQHRTLGLSEDLAALIEAEIYAGRADPVHPTQFHCELQARLQVLGERLGYKSKAE